jgi:WD40 repeat protein
MKWLRGSHVLLAVLGLTAPLAVRGGTQPPARAPGPEPRPLKLVWSTEQERPIRGVAFSPDGKILAAANQDGTVRLVDAATGRGVHTLTGHKERVNGVAFSPDGTLLASASADGTVRLWNPGTGAPVRTLVGHSDKARCVRFSRDGSLLASGGDDKTVRLWNPRTGTPVRTLGGHLGGVMGAAFSPDGKMLASCDGLPDQKGEVRLWSLATGALLRTLWGHTSEVWAVQFSQDGATLASTGSDYSIRLWDPATGRMKRSFREGSMMTSLSLSPDGRLVAVGTFETDGARLSGGVVHIRSTATGRLHVALTGLKGPALGVAFSRDGKALASGSGYEAGDDKRPGELKVWNVEGLSAEVARRERIPELALKMGHRGYVASVACSPDGQRIASGNWGAPGEIKVWNPRTGELERTLNAAPAPVLSLCWSPDGRWLASGAWNGWVQLWGRETGDLLFTRRVETGPIYAVAFSPDGKTLASAGEDRIVRFWDPDTGDLRRALPPAGSPLRSLALSPDGKRLITAGGAGHVEILDTTTGAVLHTLSGHIGTVNQARFSPDGNTVASGGDDQTVRLWDARRGTPVRVLTGQPDPVTAVGFSPDGALLASNSGEAGRGASPKQPVPRAEVRLWNPQTGTLVRTLAAGGHFAPDLAFAPDGRTLAVGVGGFSSGEVQLWDPHKGEQRFTLRGQQYEVTALSLSPDGSEAAAASGQTLKGDIKIWDLRNGTVSRTVSGLPGAANDVAYSADGARLAAGSWNSVYLWDAKSRQPIRTLTADPGAIGLVLAIGLSPDGTRLAGGTSTGLIPLWDSRTGQLLRTLAGHESEVYSVAFSPDGHTLASAGKDRGVRLWDVETGVAVRTLEGHIGPVSEVRFSPDGSRIATTSMDYAKGVAEIRIWDPRDGALKRTLSALTVSRSLAFSPDGTRLAWQAITFDENGIRHDLRLYDVETGQVVRTMSGHAAGITAMAFSRDGSRLVSGGEDNTVRVWDPHSGRLLATLLTLPVEETVAAPAGAKPIAVGAKAIAIGAKELPLPDEYLAFTPEGYYAGSATADRYVRFLLRGNTFPAESFQARFYRPDLVRQALAGAEPPPVGAFTGQYPPLVRFTSQPGPAKVTGPTVQLALEAADDSGVRDVALFLNGTRVAPRAIAIGAKAIAVGAKPISVGAKGFPGTHPSSRAVTVALTLPAGEDTIRVQAIAFDEDGLQSPREEILFTRDSRPAASGKLLGLCVGVSRYRDRELDLRYAHRDAMELAEALSRQRGVYRSAEAAALTDQQATRSGVQAALDGLLTQATKADTVIVFLSGHGWQAENRSFYFATHEVDRRDIARTALPWSDVVQRLARLSERSRRVVVLLDACHSGSAATNEELVKSLLSANAGVLVLASSKGREVSLESDELKHGTFTKAVLEAIGGQAAAGEKSVTILDFLSYVARRVRALTQDAQHPHVPFLQDFDTDTVLVTVPPPSRG